MPIDPKLKKRLFAAAIILAAVVLLWPLTLGSELREIAAKRLLASDWNPPYRALPMLAIAHNQALRGQPDWSLLDKIREQLSSNKISHAEFFWLELAVLEYGAGRNPQAKEALKQAVALDRKIVNMVQGPDYREFRGAMGI